jgi:pyruvate dehydrogenase (quinone)
MPPLPPHVTLEQARSLLSALRGGDPNARALMRESFRQKVLEFLPGR